MTLVFLVIALYVFFILWCLSDNFRIAVINRLALRKLKSRIGDGFRKIKIAEMVFKNLDNEDNKKVLADALISEMNNINKYYKFFMCSIYEDIKTCKAFKFIYEDKFNECIETARKLEKQCNNLLARYTNKL